jgi:hypothetical protein
MPQPNRPRPVPSYETLDERINGSMKPFSAEHAAATNRHERRAADRLHRKAMRKAEQEAAARSRGADAEASE